MLPGIAWIAECVLTLAVVFFAFTELRAVRARREERTRPIEEGGPFRERPSVSEPSDDGAAGRRARAWAVAAMVVALGAMIDPGWIFGNPFPEVAPALTRVEPIKIVYWWRDLAATSAIVAVVYLAIRLAPAIAAASAMKHLPRVGPFDVPAARPLSRIAIAIAVLVFVVAGARFWAGGIAIGAVRVQGLITPPDARGWQRIRVWAGWRSADERAAVVMRDEPVASFYEPEARRAIAGTRPHARAVEGVACTVAGEPTLITWDADEGAWHARRVEDASGFDANHAPAFRTLPRATPIALFEMQDGLPYAVIRGHELRVSDMPWVVAPPGWPVVLSGLALAFALFAESRARRDRLGACAWRAFGALAVLESTSIVMAMYCAYF